MAIAYVEWLVMCQLLNKVHFRTCLGKLLAAECLARLHHKHHYYKHNVVETLGKFQNLHCTLEM